MHKFLFSYRMPEDFQPGRPDTTAAWTAFFAGMGDHVLDLGQPVSETAELGHCGAGTRPGGYSLISADDLESAVTLAKGARPWPRAPAFRSASSSTYPTPDWPWLTWCQPGCGASLRCDRVQAGRCLHLDHGSSMAVERVVSGCAHDGCSSSLIMAIQLWGASSPSMIP